MLLKSEVGFSFQLFRDTCPIFTGTKRQCYSTSSVVKKHLQLIYVHVPSQEIWSMGGKKSNIGVDFITRHCSASVFRSHSFQGGDKA